MTTDLLIPVSQDNSDANALSVAAKTAFLPRIKLCQAQSKECTKKPKICDAGDFVLVVSKDDVQSLGDEVEMVVCAGRAKAIRTGEVIMTVFDPADPEFKKIEEESKDKESGCMWGPEYLVYLPAQDTFATLFMNSPTARREAGAVHARIGRAALLTSTYIETDKYSWFGPKCGDLSTPIANRPENDVFMEEISKFKNEKPTRMKTADDSAESGDRVR